MTDDLVGFTIRVTPELNAQLKARASTNGRSRSKEVVMMLEALIDRVVSSDLQLMQIGKTGQP